MCVGERNLRLLVLCVSCVILALPSMGGGVEVEGGKLVSFCWPSFLCQSPLVLSCVHLLRLLHCNFTAKAYSLFWRKTRKKEYKKSTSLGDSLLSDGDTLPVVLYRTLGGIIAIPLEDAISSVAC